VRIGGIVVGAAGIGGAVLGGVFASQHGSLSNQANTEYVSCHSKPTGCTKTQQDDIQNKDSTAASDGTIAGVAFAGGGVLLLGGVTLIIVGGAKSSSTGMTVSPWFTGNVGGVRGTF
jgi:hypothetical protein